MMRVVEIQNDAHDVGVSQVMAAPHARARGCLAAWRMSRRSEVREAGQGWVGEESLRTEARDAKRARVGGELDPRRVMEQVHPVAGRGDAGQPE